MRLFIIFTLSLFVFCGCIDTNGTITFGDCENGYGTKCWKDGGYETGNWRNGELLVGDTNFLDQHHGLQEIITPAILITVTMGMVYIMVNHWMEL